MRQALRHCSSMLGELRTSQLAPQKYYDLYMTTFEELRYLEMYMLDGSNRGKYSELYETVQHAGNILPRLYLLVTAGSAYIKSKEGVAKEILKDMVEMCAGVQHPLRGLFLRTYLSQMTKDKLPDVGNDYEGAGGTVEDSVEFVMRNFVEMNKLWVRLQNQGPTRERGKREKERKELEDLVGKNLVYLSQLEGVDIAMYKSNVLPRVLEQVVSCKDELAQLYLVDCLIQCFPDDFHLETMDRLLGVIPQLKSGVSKHTLLCQFMDRISRYIKDYPDMGHKFEEEDTFSKLLAAMEDIVTATMSTADAMMSYRSLLRYAVDVHKGGINGIAQVFKTCALTLKDREPASLETDAKSVRELTMFLTEPAKVVPYTELLLLPEYVAVTNLLDYSSRRDVICTVLGAIVAQTEPISDKAKAQALMDYAVPLIVVPDGVGVDEEDMEDGENLIARVVHLFQADTVEDTYDVLFNIAHKGILAAPKTAMRRVLPALVFTTLQLVKRVKDDVDAGRPAALEPQAVMREMQKMIDDMVEIEEYQVAMRLYLQSCLAADGFDLKLNAYAFFECAFDVFDRFIVRFREMEQALAIMTSTLAMCKNFAAEDREILASLLTRWSTNRVKKVDRARGLLGTCHLYYTDGHRDAKRVGEYLGRAVKLADEAAEQGMASHNDPGPAVVVLIEILNKYLYFLDKAGTEIVSPDMVQGLVKKIEEAMAQSSRQSPEVHKYFVNTLGYIDKQKAKGEALYATM